MFTVKGMDFDKQTLSIDQGIESIIDARRERHDIMCPLKHMRLGMNTDGKIVMEHIDGKEYVPTTHCLKQMATWMHVPHGFLKSMTQPVINANGSVKFERDQQDMEVLLTAFKNGVRNKRVDPEKEFRFRTYTDGTLRAMLSDRYAIIDNVWYLEQLKNIFSDIGGDEPRLFQWRGNADTLYGSLLLPDTITDENDSDYGGMISLSNCEIGTRRLGQFPALFRSICTNGMIFGLASGSKIHQKHLGDIDLQKLAVRIEANLKTQLPIIKSGVTRFLSMKDRKFDVRLRARLSYAFAQLAVDNTLSYGQKGQAVSILQEFDQYEKSDYNMFGMVNAVTRAAQRYGNDEWTRLETIGGDLMEMTDNQWSGFNHRALAMDKKVHDKVFGIVAA